MKFLRILVLCIVSGSVFAQQPLRCISGKVADKHGSPLEGVNVNLFRYPDSIRIAAAVTDSNGTFILLKLQSGDFYLGFSRIGFQMKYLSLKLRQGTDEHIGSITLENLEQQLSSVIVEGSHKMVKMDAGSTIFQIDGERSGLHPNVLEILRSLPGLTVNEDGIVSLNGQLGASIRVNGNSIFLAGDQLVSYLRALPSSSLKQIELITAPSAMHDAEGKVGLINIQTLSAMPEGWTLNLNMGYEQHQNGRRNVGARLTYQKNRTGLFADYSHQSGGYKSALNMLRVHTKQGNGVGNQTFFLKQNSGREEDNNGNRVGLGIDHIIDKTLRTGVSANGNIFGKNSPGYTDATFSIGENPVDSILHTRTHSNQKQKIFTAGSYLNYKDNQHTTVDLSLDYLAHSYREGMVLNDEMISPIRTYLGANNMSGDTKGNITMFSAQINGTRMVSSLLKISTGAKFVWVDVANEALYKNQVFNTWEMNQDLSRTFNYRENINSVYLQANAKLDRFDVEGGLRLEQTNLQDQDYVQLFPEIKIQYAGRKESNSFSLLYNRRLTRPNYRDLSPFSYIWDEYTRAVGNPDLHPELTDHIEVIYLYRKDYRGILFFANTKYPIMQNITLVGDNSALVYPDNFRSSQRFGLRFDVTSLKVKPFWAMGINTSLSYAKYGWTEFGQNIRKKLLTLSSGLNSQFTLPKKWTSEFSGFYTGRMAFGKATINPHYSLSFSIQKRILNDKLILKVYGNDLFQSNRQNLDIDFIQNKIYASTRQSNDYRCIGLSLFFTFKGGQQMKGGPRESGIDQSSRINM